MNNSKSGRLWERMFDAIVYYRILGDEGGRPRKIVFLDFSPDFARMAGIGKDAPASPVGMMATGMPPGLLSLGFDWLGTQALLADSDEPLKIDHYSAALNCWYEVTLCKDELGCFAAFFRRISPREMAENKLERSDDLFTTLLANIPGCHAMILRKYSREIVAANKVARNTGALPGEKCFKIAGGRDDACPFCLAPRLWASGEVQRTEIKYRGTWYKGVWAPLSQDLYVHYVLDISGYKLAQQKVSDYSLELEQLYTQLDGKLKKIIDIHKRAFPTRIPQMKGISLAAHYQPARRLGGDFYDIIQVGRKMVLYLSDVSGHGPEGALLSTFVKEAIRSYISLKPEEIQPQKILCHLYRQYLQEDFPEDYFICIFLAVFNSLTKMISYAGAGFQTPPLVQMGDGGQLQLISKGLPISNAIPAAFMAFTAKQIVLSPGSSILFHTDGLAEQEVNGNRYGIQLPNLLSQNCHLPPEEIVQAINENFRKFNGGHLQGNDDITFVVLKVDPQ